jgi:membrane protein implicated in regulation of membrane protease activity
MSDHNPNASGLLEDSGAGLAMFVIFTTAVLVVTGAVALVALLNTWWILGVAIAIHMLTTIVVVATIVSVMNGRSRAQADRRSVETRRRPREAYRWVQRRGDLRLASNPTRETARCSNR